jgi:hypothetical protein
MVINNYLIFNIFTNSLSVILSCGNNVKRIWLILKPINKEKKILVRQPDNRMESTCLNKGLLLASLT